MQLESNWLPHSRLDTIAPVGSSHLVGPCCGSQGHSWISVCPTAREHAVSSAVRSHRLVEYCTPFVAEYSRSLYKLQVIHTGHLTPF